MFFIFVFVCSNDVHFFSFRAEMPILGKFGPKNQNCQFKVKLDTWTNSNMQNSMVIFSSFFFDRKYPFWANSVQNVKIIALSRNLVASLIPICRIQSCYLLFAFLTRNTFFVQILVRKIKIVSLRWNLIPRLIRISRI